jgi:ParB-like chromosome segregation protein Spo0J
MLRHDLKRIYAEVKQSKEIARELINKGGGMELVSVNDIYGNEDNPRTITDEKLKGLIESVKKFPKMLELRPIVINKDNVVLGGNMRLKACIGAGLKEVPVLRADDLTEEQQKEFIIKDNVSGGAWDWDILGSEWNKDELENWGLDFPKENDGGDPKEKEIALDSYFKIELDLENEQLQEEVYNEMIERGYECRILTL